MVLLERSLVARGAAGVGKDLDEADLAQDVERAVDRAEADGRHLGAHAHEDRLGRKVCPVA